MTATKITERQLSITDNTTGNASTSAHGFVPKLINDPTKYYDSTGAYTVPAGGGGGGGDMLANFVNSASSSSNPSATTLVANTWNYITATSACNAKLPTPTAGHVIGVRIVDSSTNLFTLNPNASEKIQPGANTSRIMWAGESAILVANGTDWLKVAGLPIPMLATIKLSASQGLISAGTETLITLDTKVTDNTGLMVNTGSHRLDIQRTGTYTVTGVVSFSGAADGSVGVANVSGAEANLLDNAGAGGAVLPGGQAKNTCGAGTNDASIVTTLASLTAGHYVALEAYMGGDNFYALVANPASVALSAVEVPSW